uniref:CCR4-NOT transcription complex subunit 1 n=3 Tax=Mesocestoides corti TaxID=53468 RepID=A0A5K3FDQ3_MESCO
MPGAECRSLSIFQIDCLVSSLNKKNSRAAFAEIYQLCAQNSSATERHLLCSLFSNIDLSQCDTKKSSKDSPQLSYLIQELQSFQLKPNFTSLICFALQASLSATEDRSQGKPGASSVTKNSAQHPLLAIVTKLLNSVSFTSGLAAGLTLTHATKAEVSLHFQRWFLSRLSDFVKPLELANQECSLSEAQEQLATLKTGLLEDIGVEVLHFLLMHLLLPSNPYHLTPVATSTLRRVLREGFQDSRVPLVLSCCLSLSSDDNTNDADEELTSEAWFPDSGLLRALTAPSCPVVDRLAEENVDAVAANVGRTHEVGDSLLADVIEELGFAATSTLDAVKLVLSEFEPEDVTPAAVARCLCMFMQTASGRGQAPPSHHQTENLTDLLSTNCNSPGAGNRRLDNLRVDEDVNEWNLDNFLAGVHDFNANLSLYQIILELDCPRFYVQDHAGFMLLKRFLLYETRDHELPVELFYRPWNNAPGQLSFLQQCSLHPDTNCLTYWPFTCVDLEGFKLSSEDKSAAVQIWKNVDYVKALLNISTRGLFAEVRGLFMRAFNLCPDIFTATLLETPHMPPLKCSMLSLAFARFLLPRPNSQILLQTAWSGCQKNLSACERQLLRGHLLAAALQLMHSWTCNINGLNNSNLEPASDTPPQPTFFNLIEVVMRIQGNPVMPLAMLLGSRNRPVSIAVCQLWPTVDVSAIESCEGSPVHRLAPPPVPLLLDLALCVVVYMVDAVKTLMDAASSEGHSQHRQLQLSAIQSSLDSFLTNWFVEQMTGEKEDVDLFCVQLVDYLRRRYPTLADALAPPAMPISTQAPPPPLPSTVADPNRHLPDHLRQPGYALIRHVINSARKALRSPSICVSPKVAAEAHQALAFFLQNLARIYCLPGTSTAGSCVAADQGSTVVASPHHLHPPVSTSAWTHPKEASAARSAIAVGLSSLVQRLPQTGLMSGPVQPPCAGGGTPLSPPIYLSFSNDPIELDLPTDVEFQVNSFFVKLLQAVNTPEEMLKVAYDYATSDSANQKKYLDGILRMLAYEVSRHLHDYPEHVLKPITELYGGVLATVASHLSVPALSMLWRAFLTRLYLFQPDTPVDSHLYAGVVRVLMKAKPTLVRYANLTSHLINCPIFKLFPADLREAILSADAFAKNFQRTAPHHAHLTGSQSLKDLQSYNQQQAPGILSQEYIPPEAPDEVICDRIYFLFNNVSKTNAKEKSEELCGLLQESLLPWFAYYLVCKRITVEQSFHDIFASVIDTVQASLPDVRPRVLFELIRSIKAILRSIRTDMDDTQSRSSLKNLGRFLGLFTLARNKAILHDDLNIKDLIYEAYYKGALPLLYVVPFVAHVIRGAVDSIAFRPPNPYTMGILKVLRELYDMRDVKVKLKFEIEILFKAFDYTVDNITAAEFLRDRNRLANLETQLIFLVSAGGCSGGGGGGGGGGVNPPSPATVSQATGQAQQPGPYDSAAIDYNPRTLAALAQHQQQRLAAVAAQQQQMYTAGGGSTSGGRPNVVAALQGAVLDGVQPNSSATGFGQRGGDPIYSAGAGGPNDENIRRKWEQALVALQNQFTSQTSQQQPQQQVQPLNRQQQQQPMFSQVAPMTGVPQQALPSVSVAAYNVGAATSGAIGGAGSASHVVSATQMMNHHQPRDAAQSASLSSAGGLLLRYEDVDLATVRSCINVDELIQQIAVYSQSSSQNAGGGGGSSSAAAAAMSAMALLHSEPSIRQLILPAIEKAVNELITPLFERCCLITVPTVETVVRKDFALQPDPAQMLRAAKQMVRHLAASVSLITAREALSVSLGNNLTNIIWNSVKPASQQEKEAVEFIAMLVVSKSMHVCLAYMQKTVAERAVREVEKKLEPDVKMRQELGPRRFLEQVTAAHQSLPECVQSHPFVLRPMRPTVYQEFERSIPGFAPSAAASLSPGCIVPAQPSSQAQQQILQRATGLIAQQPPPNTSATSSQQQQQQKMAVAAAAHLLLQQQQQHQAQQQYLQQHSGTSAASQQPAPPIGGLFDTVVVHIRRHLGAIRSWLASSSATAAGTFPQDSPMVRSLQNLIESAQLAKTTSSSNSGSGGESAGVRLIATLVQSLLTHYRPSRWADQPGGLQAMEHLKEAHMITLRHLLSCEQSSWVARQVTCQWIQLPDGDLEPSSTNIQPASYASRVEHLSTLATIAMAKSAQTAVSSAGNAGASDEASANDAGIVGSKWNWEAFAELLKVHVIYLTQIDAYLAGKIASGHQAATTFVLNLLDHFVLPSLMGTSSVNQVGSGSATASQGVTDTSSTPMAGTIAGVSSSPSNPTANPNSSVASLLGSLSNTLALINSKREFTVLNEYDFWLTIHALQAHQRNTLISPGDTNLRLRLSCARIRALLDWGLLGEQSVVTLCPPTAPETSALFAGCSRAREFDDTPQMKAKTETFFRWWSDFYRNQNVTCENESLVDQVINNLANLGVLSVDENLTRFFRLATIYVVERALSTLKIAEQAPPNFSSATRVNGYYELDAYARLISITISRIGARSETATEGNRAKFALLNKVLGIIGGTLLQGHEVRPELFHAMPFQRILVRLFVDLYAMCGSVKETSSGRSEGEESTGLTLLEYVPLAYGNLLHMLRPERATNFIFAWLEIVAHREFVDQTLGASRKDGVSPTLRAAYRAVYAQLLVDILKFLSFYLQNALLPKPIACLYTATFRLCLVLFHDFPDFVTEYCVLLSNIVPSDSLQLRNLLLSAEPRRGVPSTDPLNAPPVDQLSQLEDPSGYCMEAGERLPPILRGEIDTYLTSRAPVKLLSELVTMLRLTDSLLTFLINPPGLYTSALAAATAATQTTRGEHDGGEAVSQEAPPQPQGKKAKKAAAAKAAAAAAQQQAILSAAGQQANAAMLWSARATQHLSTFGLADNLHYNVELMMNVVLYICITAVKTLRETGMPLNMTTVAHTPQMDIIQSLVLNLDNEGRYLLLNCMANQLRYPNSHTYYFSYTILYLFAEQSKEQVKEQISRVLMERLIVNRPHPWGLLMTSAELLRNPVYRFWEHEFARCHKDMEDIVTIVARSCISNFNPPTGAAPQSSSSSASQQQQTALATGGASQPPSGSLPRNPQHPSPGDSKPAATLTS